MVYRAEKWNIRRSELFKENFGDFMTTEEEYDDYSDSELLKAIYNRFGIFGGARPTERLYQRISEALLINKPTWLIEGKIEDTELSVGEGGYVLPDNEIRKRKRKR